MLQSLEERVSVAKKVGNLFSSSDERLDAIIVLLTQQLKLAQPSMSGSLLPVQPPYSIRSLALDNAKSKDNPEELIVPGSFITFYTTGSFVGTEFALDSPTSDWIPITYFGNPYNYGAVFQKIYLSWSAQPGKLLWLHIGRRTGTSPGMGPPAQTSTINIKRTYTSFIFNQLSVGLTAVQLSSTVFQPQNGVLVKADDNNTGNIYVGDSTVTTSNGFRLTAGQAISLELDDSTKIYVVASAALQKVHFMAI